MPTHWNRNRHTIVSRYDWPLEEGLKGHCICVLVSRPEDIMRIKKHLHETTQVNGFIVDAPEASLESMEINPEWGETPVVLKLNRLGKFGNVCDKLNLMKRMNVTLIFCGNVAQNCTDATIVASLGLHTGIEFRPDMELPEELMDLVTYNFYNRVPHGRIEPFATMHEEFSNDTYVSPLMAQLRNPDRYIHVDKEGRLSFYPLREGEEGFDRGLDKLYEISSHPAIEEAKHSWQQMFIDSHPCTFCPAFRVCMGFFAEQSESGRCREVMNEVLEGLEFMNESNQKKGDN